MQASLQEWPGGEGCREIQILARNGTAAEGTVHTQERIVQP